MSEWPEDIWRLHWDMASKPDKGDKTWKSDFEVSWAGDYYKLNIPTDKDFEKVKKEISKELKSAQENIKTKKPHYKAERLILKDGYHCVWDRGLFKTYKDGYAWYTSNGNIYEYTLKQ